MATLYVLRSCHLPFQEHSLTIILLLLVVLAKMLLGITTKSAKKMISIAHI